MRRLGKELEVGEEEEGGRERRKRRGRMVKK